MILKTPLFGDQGYSTSLILWKGASFSRIGSTRCISLRTRPVVTGQSPLLPHWPELLVPQQAVDFVDLALEEFWYIEHAKFLQMDLHEQYNETTLHYNSPS